MKQEVSRKGAKAQRVKTVKAAKEPVRIRFKTLQNGNKSIYLDVYRDGVREYDFLKLYIVPELNDNDREKNRKTLELANKIKAKKILELDNVEHGFEAGNGEKQKESVAKFISDVAEKRKKEGAISMYYSLRGLRNHLALYKGSGTIFKQVTKEYCRGFIDYLKTAKNVKSKEALSVGSQSSYSRLLTVVLNLAMQEGHLSGNPMNMVPRGERLKQPESDREYLTIEEVKQLVNTPCVKPMVRQAFLFMCFSGLRYSDVRYLRWGDIQTDNEGEKVIRYMQKKTKKYENLQVSSEALKYLPERGGANDDDTIFKLSQNGYTNQALAGWVLGAGIKKRVTFHVGRHTNATLLLSLGAPIETVSKLLGHSDIKTTQIYAKVIDQNKRAAVSKLDGLLG